MLLTLKKHILLLFTFLFFFTLGRVAGQECYKPISGSGVVVGGISGTGICASSLCLGSNYLNLQNVIDTDLDSRADWGNAVMLLSLQGISVKIPAENIAGYIVSQAGLTNISVLNTMTVSTYLNSSQQEVLTFAKLRRGSLIGEREHFYLTFATTLSFDKVRSSTCILNVSLLSTPIRCLT